MGGKGTKNQPFRNLFTAPGEITCAKGAFKSIELGSLKPWRLFI